MEWRACHAISTNASAIGASSCRSRRTVTSTCPTRSAGAQPGRRPRPTQVRHLSPVRRRHRGRSRRVARRPTGDRRRRTREREPRCGLGVCANSDDVGSRAVHPPDRCPHALRCPVGRSLGRNARLGRERTTDLDQLPACVQRRVRRSRGSRTDRDAAPLVARAVTRAGQPPSAFRARARSDRPGGTPSSGPPTCSPSVASAVTFRTIRASTSRVRRSVWPRGRTPTATTSTTPMSVCSGTGTATPPVCTGRTAGIIPNSTVARWFEFGGCSGAMTQASAASDWAGSGRSVPSSTSSARRFLPTCTGAE